MDSQTLAVEAQREQLFSMFYQRGLICSVKYFNLVVVLFCVVSVLASCKQHPVNEEQNQLVFGACLSPDVGESLDNVCLQSNSFCFPSTLTGCLVKEPDAESEESHASVGFPSGFKEKRSNHTLSQEHGIFTFLSGKSILCSLYKKDDFLEKSQMSDDSSCVSPLFDTENAKSVKSGFFEVVSAPPLEIRPELLDWGEKNIYHPSLAFLALKNLDSDSVLSIYAPPYSSNPQFYPCNFSEMIVLDPGEVASLCFVFFPTQLGVASAQLVLQTSFGGFVIGAKGFAIQSPYLIMPLDISSSGRWRKNLSLFNPFDDALFVEKVTASIFTSSGNNLATCSVVHSTEDYARNSVLNFEIGREISMKPLENWEVGPRKKENVLELDVLYNFKGKIIGTFCLQLLRPSKNEIDTVMIPLKEELHQKESVSVSVKALGFCGVSGSLVAALSVRNDSPDLISVLKVREVGESGGTFLIKSVDGLILFPHSNTEVAILNYDHPEASEVNVNCRLLVDVNDTRNSELEIPCKDVISVCSGRELDSSVGYTEAMDTREADEFVLRNWKSQASKSLMSVLDANELLFPLVQVGNYSSQWISVKNPSPEPVVMQLVLNSAEVIHNCRKSEMIFEPSLVGSITSVAPEGYGFSIAKDALTEAFVYPYGIASLGPIIFQPSDRCEWRSSVLIRSNLSGVEWMSLRGFGGSLSVALFEGSDHPVQSLEFKLNLPAQLNATSVGPSCSRPLTKEVLAKNTGDFPLEILRVGVSGVGCILDGFRVNNCDGFSLQPGESSAVWISYFPDFSSGTIRRDLELVFPAGILVIPMKASLPIYVLDFCKRTIFWMRVKKSSFMLVFAASLSVLLVYVVFPQITAIASEEFKNGQNPFSTVIRSLNYLCLLKKSSSNAAEINRFVESAAMLSDNVNPSEGHPNQTQSESGLVSDSQNLSVRVGKEVGRRRRKKKRSGTTGAMIFEVSSSHSSNSTPSSPLSPVSFTTQRPVRPWPVSPEKQQPMETRRNPFAQAPKNERPKISSRVNALSAEGQNRGFMAQEKQSTPRKPVLLPSATFPSANRVASTWTCDLASTSPIAPYARAPGSKLHNQKSAELEKKTGVEDKFVYDIWGDHLFGLPLTPLKSKGVICNNSHSFFVGDPQILVKNSLLKPVSSDMGKDINNKN